MFSLRIKTAVITGGARGIGLAVAKMYVEAGAKVIITDLRDDGATVAGEFGAGYIRCDISDEQGVIDMFNEAESRLGKLDIAVLNLGEHTRTGEQGESECCNSSLAEI